MIGEVNVAMRVDHQVCIPDTYHESQTISERSAFSWPMADEHPLPKMSKNMTCERSTCLWTTEYAYLPPTMNLTHHANVAHARGPWGMHT